MKRFKSLEWHLQKFAAHALSAEEAEAAFDRPDERDDGSFRMLALLRIVYADTTTRHPK